MRTIFFVMFIALSVVTCTNKSHWFDSNSRPETLNKPGYHLPVTAFFIKNNVCYQANLGSISTPVMDINLILTTRHHAEMTTDYLGNIPTMIDRGIWKTLQNGNLLLSMQRKKGLGTLQLEFNVEGEKLVYTGSEKSLSGLVFRIKPVP